MNDFDRLVAAAFIGHVLSDDEVWVITEHIALAGFDPAASRKVGGGLAGLVWRGRELLPTDKIATAERHYLKHVVQQEEWAKSITLEDYQHDGFIIASDQRSGVFVSQREGRRLIGIIGHAPEMVPDTSRGAWTLIEYSLATRHWETLFRPNEGLAYLENDPRRESLRWLRRTT